MATHSFNEAVAVGDAVAILYRGHLVGKRSVGSTSVEKLRAFYFQATGELDDLVLATGSCA